MRMHVLAATIWWAFGASLAASATSGCHLQDGEEGADCTGENSDLSQEQSLLQLRGLRHREPACVNDRCDSAICPGRSSDPWCPNCRGQDFQCLASRKQVGLGNSDALGATYNNFALPNTGYCAMQKRFSPSRSQTMGPKLLTRGLVFGGVGVSQAQFGGGASTAEVGMNPDGAVSCGMCLEVDVPMVRWNCELTQILDRRPTMQKLLVIVMDQCIDSWTRWSSDGTRPLGNCVSGHLDFDVYSPDTGVGNMANTSWRAVDCPVGALPIELVFSSGGTPGSGYYFAFHLRDLRVPASKVEVRCPDGSYRELEHSPNGFSYGGACGEVSWPALQLRLTSVHGEAVTSTLSFDPSSLKQPSSEDAVYLPPVSLGTQFRIGRNPPSAEANANYRDCVTRVGPAPTPVPAPSPAPSPPRTTTAPPRPQPAPSPAPSPPRTTAAPPRPQPARPRPRPSGTTTGRPPTPGPAPTTTTAAARPTAQPVLAPSPATTTITYSRSTTTAPQSTRGPSPPVSSACIDDRCDSSICPGRTADPWCPNCRGQDFKCLASQTQVALGDSDALGATYNNFALPNIGFCAMQRRVSPSRSQTMGPKLLTQGLVFSGVGVSQAQFGDGVSTAQYGMNGDGAIACGMCLEVALPMVRWDCELTRIVDRVQSMQKLVVIVMDQCNDKWALWNGDGTQPAGNCASGHLDFDVYSADTGSGNMRNVTWRAVDCPVGELPIELVFSSGDSPGSGYYFAFHLRDLRVPAARVEVRCRDGSYQQLGSSPNGFSYAGACGEVSWPALTLRLTSVHGEVVTSTLQFDPSTRARPSADDPVFLPPVPFGAQFTVGYNPPSLEANANYRDCVKPLTRST